MAAKRKYSAEDLQRAIAECRSKSEPNVHGVALKYGIPPSTLDDHVKGKVKKVGAGGSTVLSRQVEQEIVLSCIALADIGFGITYWIEQSRFLQEYARFRKPHPLNF